MNHRAAVPHTLSHPCATPLVVRERTSPRWIAVVVAVVAAVAVLGVGGAQAPAAVVWTPDLVASEAIDVAAEVVQARIDVAAAARDAARVLADPTTLRLAQLDVQHALAAAEDAAFGAAYATGSQARRAFADVLEARDDLALAQADATQARVRAEALAIRLQAGAATSSDLVRAEDAVRAAERAVRDADTNARLAEEALANDLGVALPLPELMPFDPPGAVPALDALLARAGENAALRAAWRAVERAEAALDAIDEPFTTPRAELEAARDRLEVARLQGSEREETVRSTIRRAHAAAVAAEGRLASARERLASAEEDARVQEVRFEAGSIARIDVDAARIDVDRARADVRTAVHAVHDALRALEAAVIGSGS